jgi:lysophospholipase L1-like esterase
MFRRLQALVVVVGVSVLAVMCVQTARSSHEPAAGAAVTPTTVAAGAPSTAPATTAPRGTSQTAGVPGGSVATVGSTAPATSPAPAIGANGITLDPSWPKTLYVISDSVVLGVKTSLPARMAGWQVTIDGRPALMVKQATKEITQRGTPVGTVAVVALGYNSLWEKNRRNYDKWAKKFDDEAEAMIAELTTLGVKKIVWVTLREPTADTVPAKAVKELPQYSWYFPWANERIHAIQQRHPEVAVADWTAVSNRNGITFDSIHLNPEGQALMAEVIAKAVGA